MPSSPNVALTNWLDGSRRSLRTTSQFGEVTLFRGALRAAGQSYERSERHIPRTREARPWNDHPEVRGASPRHLEGHVRNSFILETIQYASIL